MIQVSWDIAMTGWKQWQHLKPAGCLYLAFNVRWHLHAGATALYFN